MEKGFTLVIPLYNKIDCIRGTLNSVLYNHGNYPFKCIIVDDDSTDGSSDIGEEYDEKYPDIFEYYKIKHHGNKTPVYARNLGIDLCKTEYIGFLDADDELCEGFIDRGCKFLDEHPEYSLYSNGHKVHGVDEKGRDHYTTRNYSFTWTDNFIASFYAGAQDIHFCSSIYKTELVLNNLFTDVFNEDAVFKMKYIYKYPHVYVDNSTCESIIWNTFYSNSREWNIPRTNQTLIVEVYNTIKNELPGFKFEFEFIDGDKVFIKEKSSE